MSSTPNALLPSYVNVFLHFIPPLSATASVSYGAALDCAFFRPFLSHLTRIPPATSAASCPSVLRPVCEASPVGRQRPILGTDTSPSSHSASKSANDCIIRLRLCFICKGKMLINSIKAICIDFLTQKSLTTPSSLSTK
jgi:hypothetical protein